jgi:predicted RNase H-like nuclease
MNFVGLDLAWGSLNLTGRLKHTGITVLDANGHLKYIGAAVTDDEILTALRPYVEGPCVVGIDAPLMVTNPTGMRPAEIELNRVFGLFDAGAFPAAIDKFSNNPRGARLAKTLGLDIDPHSTGPRRAIEVFPHPATVALFKLGRIFKFKRGSLEQRRPELLKYMQAIESLATSSVPMYAAMNDDWNRLRQTVEQAQRLVDLDRAEDPIDAALCAYIALYAERRQDDVTIYGDYPANGYILTPTLPPGLKPTPREPAAAAPTTSTVTKSPSPRISAACERCVRLVTAVHTAWNDIDTKTRKLDSIPLHGATDVSDSLGRVAVLLELAEQELTSIRDQLAQQATEETGTSA